MNVRVILFEMFIFKDINTFYNILNFNLLFLIIPEKML